jgi:hypothetical protein
MVPLEKAITFSGYENIMLPIEERLIRETNNET